jgi:predicted RNase H-like HicB family nuclease
MNMYRYEIILYWSAEDAAFIAEVPELPGCMAHGDTQDEALHQAQEAMAAWIEVAQEIGRDVPVPRGRLMYA